MIFWTLLVLIAALVAWLVRLNRDYHVLALFAKRIKTSDGTPLEEIAPTRKGNTIFGNAYDLFGMDPGTLFANSRKEAADMKKSHVQYTLGMPIYEVITAEEAELVMNDPNFITKGVAYRFLRPFLRLGLLTSSGKKWHTRRKMLTPAFHFNILTQFEEVFKEESRKFVEELKANNENVVSVSEVIPKFTLNSVCETALGVKLDDCFDDEQYRKSFKMIEECFCHRITNPVYMVDWIYNLFVASEYKTHLNTVHNFSSDIIKKRRQLFEDEVENKKKDTNSPDRNDIDYVFTKKRYAMLDTLLLAEKDGLIDHTGICEEVDTFMFEGFDTTSMGLIFSLMNLSLYPEMQERCYQEIRDHLDDDLTNLDVAQLNKLKYLDYFIKETLRLYPSVPTINREVIRDTTLANKLILPAGTQINIQIFDIMRNPLYFPNPDVFDPERFSPENSEGRHPYAYIPFSAGQRNCIGQKFAMAEMKTLLVYILKSFKLLPIMDPKPFAFETGIILRTQNNVKVQLARRSVLS